MTSTYDVVVVGGGPAGSSAARTAARRGLSTLLLDSAEFPRSKPCGGALSEQAMAHLDFEVSGDLHEAEVFGARVHYAGRAVSARLDSRIAVIVSRTRFDAFLFSKAKEAGVETLENTRVTSIEDLGTETKVIAGAIEFHARYCIIAAGASSRLGQAVRSPLTKDEYAVAVEMDVPCPHEQVRKYCDDLIDIYFGVAHMGYGWVFPHQEWFNVGLAGIASQMTRAREQLEQFSRDLPSDVSRNYDAAINRVGAAIPAGGLNRQIAKGRILLAGDSAGFVDSFYGEGIAYAIRSGILAAEAIADHDSPAASYTRAAEREIVRPLKYSYVLSKLLHRFPGILLRVFASHPVVLKRFLEVPARRLSYFSFLRWFLIRAPYFMLTSSSK
jgi:geranylgeranyl reductase family protein